MYVVASGSSDRPVALQPAWLHNTYYIYIHSSELLSRIIDGYNYNIINVQVSMMTSSYI